MINLIYIQMKPNEKKICFQGIAHALCGLDSESSQI